MEIAAGALSSLLPKLTNLLVEEYTVQKEVKTEIMFLKAELESMKGALEEISGTPDVLDRIWARNLSELTYDMEDIIDIFMMSDKSDEAANGIRKFIDRSVGLFRKVKINHEISIEIKNIKSRVIEVHERRQRYTEDPRLFAQYTMVTELAAINKTRDELINTSMTENNEVSPPALVQGRATEEMTGALLSVITKLGGTLVGEYNLPKAVKKGIVVLQCELEAINAALESISKVPEDQLSNQNKIWARKMRELSCNLESSIDKFTAGYNSSKVLRQQCFNNVIDPSRNMLMRPRILHNFSTEIRDIRRRAIEVHDRRSRYEISLGFHRPVTANTVDPHLFTQYTDVKVENDRTDEAKDEVIEIMTEENEVSPTLLVQERAKEIVTGAVPSVIAKLDKLLLGDYNLHNGVEDIRYLRDEVECMNSTLEDLSMVPEDQLPREDKIWAREMMELTCNIESSIDKFMVRYNSSKVLSQKCFNKVLYQSRSMLMRPMILHNFSIEIRDIRRRAIEVHDRRSIYEISLGFHRPVTANTVDPHLFTEYTDVKGEDDRTVEAKDEVIEIMTEESEVSPTLLVQERAKEIVTGAVPSVVSKLDKLLHGDYNIPHNGVEKMIRYLRDEVQWMNITLEKLLMVPEDQLPHRDKIWASNVRVLYCNIEKSIDTLIVRYNNISKLSKLQYFNKVFNYRIFWHKFAIKIRDIESQIREMNERRCRYEVSLAKEIRDTKSQIREMHKPQKSTVDSHFFSQYTDMNNELVGIDEARNEIIKIMTKENEVSTQQGKIVSIVGFGGLGKTALANVVYEKIRAQFDCCAFVSVSKTPDLKRLFKGLLYDLCKKNVNEETLDEKQLIDVLRGFLQDKRYFIVIDDIWDISTWEKINYGLPDNNLGYRIITTTRNYSVAEQVGGGTYKMMPLSLKNSKKLLCTRIFGNEKNNNNEDTGKWPDEELIKVSELILKKCAGVPLAIITIAGVLAYKARNEKEWYNVYKCIGTGLENNLDVNSMREILLFSYYELPWHLRACLLYLSMFPNDSKIDKDRIVWMWIAEGFIRYENQGKSLFEHGESYLHELINRSMIQSIYDPIDRIYSCRVHNMMLHFICSLSTAENIVTIINGMDDTSPSRTVRRLSIQNGKEDNAMILATWGSLQHLRSVVIFPAVVDPMLVLNRNFRVLRVLDLQDCDLSQNNSLNYLGNFFHLRYLGLSNTRIAHLPEEVGNLQSLQTLSVTCNEIASLPSTVVGLIHLMCLRIDMDTMVPNEIKSLTSLEELSQVSINNSTHIEVLCCLTELRVLDISCHTECMDGLEKSLVDCLSKLQKLQNLSLSVTSGEYKLDLEDVPRHLCRLNLQGCWLSSLPAWVSPSLLMNLFSISIAVIKLQKEDLERLGRLPALCYLDLKVDHENLGVLGGFVIDAGLFQCLLRCVFWGFRGALVYTQGAMPRLTSLRFTLHVWDMGEIAGSSDGGYNLGIENLLSLQDVTVLLRCGGASNQEVQQVKAALRDATKIHPNQPTIDFIGYEDKEEMIDWT